MVELRLNCATLDKTSIVVSNRLMSSYKLHHTKVALAPPRTLALKGAVFIFTCLSAAFSLCTSGQAECIWDGKITLGHIHRSNLSI